MTLTKVVGGVIADTTITSADILDSTITNAKLAVDPANASNLSSGDVPLAQLRNVPDPDLTAQKGDIALLAFKTQANVAGSVGTANTGGGGGSGNNSPGNGLAGGSGVVIISWGFVPVSYTNMTLVSTATTAQAVPTKGDMVMTYTNGAGTAVINTNIKGYVSRDGGTTYTQGTLASQ